MHTFGREPVPSAPRTEKDPAVALPDSGRANARVPHEKRTQPRFSQRRVPKPAPRQIWPTPAPSSILPDSAHRLCEVLVLLCSSAELFRICRWWSGICRLGCPCRPRLLPRRRRLSSPPRRGSAPEIHGPLWSLWAHEVDVTDKVWKAPWPWRTPGNGSVEIVGVDAFPVLRRRSSVVVA